MIVHFIGWNNQGKHDKVWGVIEAQDQMVVFWGRREGKLAFKRDNPDPMALAKKKSQTYIEHTEEEMEAASPGFMKNLRKSLATTLLGDTFHNEGNFRKISF